MKTIRYCVFACLATLMLAACHKDDDPQEEQIQEGIDNIHDMQSDKPAYIRQPH